MFSFFRISGWISSKFEKKLRESTNTWEFSSKIAEIRKEKASKTLLDLRFQSWEIKLVILSTHGGSPAKSSYFLPTKLLNSCYKRQTEFWVKQNKWQLFVYNMKNMQSYTKIHIFDSKDRIKCSSCLFWYKTCSLTHKYWFFFLNAILRERFFFIT